MARQAERSSPPLSVVTGANSGVGLEVAAGLRSAGHDVIMACRSAERCAAAAAALDARGLPGSSQCRALDLNDYQSVRRFAASLSADRPLVTLVNNAGVMGVPDGHMQPNHLGPFLLTRLLLPLMAAGGRVVTVASEAHRRAPALRISAAADGRRQLEGGDPAWWYASYGQSKLANVLMTQGLSQQLQQRRSGVTASSVSPGRVATNIFLGVPGLLQPALRWLAAAAFQTPAQGARTVLHAALAPELSGRHELYLHNCKPCAASAAARDPQLAAELWQFSCQETGLSAAEDAALWPPH
ncbi:Retinol dehydrogenase 12 [Chlorella sorokiniana]|uniref:Retinol dehydrogenase 12 n=1 Tax=Chlorella sorokiniana TaxID=3076 RepID=A0A2P6U0M8_CHLSO|nr:Retinol dehydrogenase 12 [Chlorella sorokiniana]|eukprot:PRW59869.1 Retinol dehydrogenase 12 [Chlorella sorokiniana]